ncbi:MAG: DNA-directed polymerase subunit beta [Kosmotogales bacterium]|nr:DNA-directed polymerase subunit beta [Kosmotogales bacterium]
MPNVFRRKVSSLKINIASPERILSWSSGEVKKPETINYRTFKPERDGLFCEKIFGPIKDYECSCGKYKGKKYEGTVCERCNVRVESKESRRRKMGHIELAAPVTHVWYLKSAPSILSTFLNIPAKNLENIIYYGSKRVIEKLYVVIDPKDTEFYSGQTLHHTEYEIYNQKIDFTVENGYRIRNPKGPVVSDIDGIVTVEMSEGNSKRELNWIIIKDENGNEKKYPVFEGALIYVSDGDEVRKGDTLADRFLFEDEVLSETENMLFGEHYEGKYEKESDTESDRPIVIITEIDEKVSEETGKVVGDILIENEYEAYKELYPGKLICDYGAVAVKKLLQKIDLHELKANIEHELKSIPKSSGKALKLLKRLKIVKNFMKSDGKPEWMVMEIVPVIPPEIRPMIQIEGGRFATTDLNDLYRRVINRNNRLKKLLSIGAPDIIIRNEKRMLQEAVDSLIYNGRVGKAVTDKSGRPLKSLTDLVKGKKGRFRRNLLGKRVDYSGRAVIVVGPDLKIHECGIPKRMAMELFKPFVLSKLLQGSESSKTARKLKKTIIEKEMPEAWEVLEDVIKGHPVLLNRAPTLHRISIQAFIPKLVEGNAIQLHPLVCAPFNADFDGDQMAVHLPISPAAQAESKFLLLSRYNVISPASGKPVSMPGKDIIFGVYYLTTVGEEYEEIEKKLIDLEKKLKRDKKSKAETKKEILKFIFGTGTEKDHKLQGKSEGSNNDDISADENNTTKKPKKSKNIPGLELFVFGSPEDAKLALNNDAIGLHTPIFVNFDGKIKANETGLSLTTVGRILFNEIIPNDLRDYSKKFTKKQIKKIIYDVFYKYGIDRTADLLDDMMTLGFHYSTVSGLTMSIRDIMTYPKREELIKESEKVVDEINNYYNLGFTTDQGRYEETIRTWTKTTEDLMNKTFDTFRTEKFNPIYMMVDSGARGSIDQLKQLAGMRGLMADPSGKTLEIPITSNFKDGLTELEFFTSTHGARKGSADTALRTSFAGYLTRRLVDVAQSITISTPDCGTENGIEAKEIMADGVTIESLGDFLFGRILSKDIINPATKKILVDKRGKEYVRGTMLRDEETKFLTDFTIKVPIKIEEKIKIKNIEKLNNDVVLAESLSLENETLPKETVLTWDVVRKLKNEKISEIEVFTYPSINQIFAGDESNYKNDKDEKLVAYQEDIDFSTANNLFKNGYKEIEVRPSIMVRSALTCESEHGICAMCYGMDLSNHNIVNVGESVGTVAAQSIGEPGTQLTMRTFHMGGIATGADITRGLPRAEELFEARKKLKDPEALFTDEVATVKDIRSDENVRKIYLETKDGSIKDYELSSNIKPKVDPGDRLLRGQTMTTGTVRPRKVMDKLGVIQTAMYLLTEIKRVYAEQGVEIHDKHFEIIIKQMLSKVEITDGGDSKYLPGDLVNKQEVLRINKYIEEENNKVEENVDYALGKRVAKKVLIEDDENKLLTLAEEGEVLTVDILEKFALNGLKVIDIFDVDEKQYQGYLESLDPEIEIPQKSIQIGIKEGIKFKQRLLRITKASLESEGWLAAASFQQTPQVLTEASVEGKIDTLNGLKENVLVGQLIPAGTGLDMYSNIQIESGISVPETEKKERIV